MPGYPDVRAAIRQFEFAVTLRRYGPAEIDEAGFRTRGGFAESTIRLCAWPEGGPNERGVEGQQEGGEASGVSRTELLAADTQTGQPGDILLMLGGAYEVDNVKPWPGPGLLGTTQFFEFHATQVVLELVMPTSFAAGPTLELEVT